MAVTETTYALTSLERVVSYIGGVVSSNDNVKLIQMVNGVSARMEGYCQRNFRSRTYTHDGTTLPRLDSDGSGLLFLKNRPVTSVTSLKLYPGTTALTGGYAADYTILHEEGIIELAGGASYKGRRIVEITYVGGFLDTVAAGQSDEWGWAIGGADIELACVMQVAATYNSQKSNRDGVVSRSSDGVTVTYMTDPWLPEVKETMDRYRVPL